MFHSLLQLAVKRQASDVHFEVGYPPTYRVFGELLAAKYPPLTHADTEAIANFVLQAPGSGFAPLDFREVDRSYSLTGVSRQIEGLSSSERALLSLQDRAHKTPTARTAAGRA